MPPNLKRSTGGGVYPFPSSPGDPDPAVAPETPGCCARSRDNEALEPRTMVKLLEESNTLKADGMRNDFIRLVECGIGPEDRTFVLYPRDYGQRFIVRRFYGTVFGVSPNILVRNTAIVFTTILRPGNTANQKIHIYHRWITAEKEHSVEVDQLPSFELATYGPNSIYVAFPLLHSKRRRPADLTALEFREVWEKAIYPAIAELSEAGTRRSSARMRPSLISFPERCLVSLGSTIRKHAECSDLPWMKELVFVHVVRIESEPHFLRSTAQSSNILKDHLRRGHLALNRVQEDIGKGGVWYVDVGVVISVRESATIWSADYHAQVYKELTGKDLNLKSSRYKPQLVSHMADTLGCTVVPKPKSDEGETPPGYVQLYVQDLCLGVIDQWGRRVETATASHLIDTPNNKRTFLHELALQYAHTTYDIAAAGSVRTPLQTAENALRDVDIGVLLDGVLTIGSPELWRWRALRTIGLHYLLNLSKNQTEVKDQERISLTTAITWLANANHTVPADLTISLPFPATTTAGILFLREICFGDDGNSPHFQFKYRMEASEDDLTAVLGDRPSSIIEMFTAENQDVPETPVPLPSPKGKLPFRRAIPFLGDDIPQPMFQVDDDSTLRWMDVGKGVDYTEDPVLMRHIRRIFAAFPVDVLVDAPNGSARLSSMSEYASNGNKGVKGIFYERDLAHVFNSCNWKYSTADEWKSVFDTFFPTHDSDEAVPSKLHYYELWVKLIKSLNPVSLQLLRCAMWGCFFKSAYWMPRCGRDGVWSSEPDSRFLAMPADLDTTSDVYVLVNGSCDPLWGTT